jgi:serine protease AprX
VSTTTTPIAVTLITPDWAATWYGGSPDFDLYLYDPSGALVARAESTQRQELVRYQPRMTGTYRIQVYAYSGAGRYFFDASYR